MEEQPGWKAVLINVWPTIYRMINTTFYFLLKSIKNIVSESIRQLKGGV